MHNSEILQLGYYSESLGLISTFYDHFSLTKIPAEVREHGGIAEKKSDWAKKHKLQSLDYNSVVHF